MELVATLAFLVALIEGLNTQDTAVCMNEAPRDDCGEW